MKSLCHLFFLFEMLNVYFCCELENDLFCCKMALIKLQQSNQYFYDIHFPLIMNVHILSIHNLAHVYASILRVCGWVGQNLRVGREGQMKRQSYKTPASQPIRVKALVDSQ